MADEHARLELGRIRQGRLGLQFADLLPGQVLDAQPLAVLGEPERGDRHRDQPLADPGARAGLDDDGFRRAARRYHQHIHDGADGVAIAVDDGLADQPMPGDLAAIDQDAASRRGRVGVDFRRGRPCPARQETEHRRAGKQQSPHSPPLLLVPQARRPDKASRAPPTIATIPAIR